MLLNWFSFSRMVVIQSYLKGDDWFKENFFSYYDGFLQKDYKIRKKKDVHVRERVFKKFRKI